MPVYKNRMPMPADTPVWHYTSLPAVNSMLRDRQIRLTRVDRFSDPFEGSIPKKQYDDQLPTFSSSDASDLMAMGVAVHHPDMPTHGTSLTRRRRRDRWTEWTERRKAQKRSTHAICWRWGDESEAMWRLYCNDGKRRGQGLALRTTLGKLEASVSHLDLYVSPVRYRYYHEGAAFDDELDPFLHKRQGFVHEQEVRLLTYDRAHYIAYSNYLTEDGPAPVELPEHLLFDWPFTDAIDAITVSPYASKAYESRARRAIEAVSHEVAETIELSVLSERRYAVNL